MAKLSRFAYAVVCEFWVVTVCEVCASRAQENIRAKKKRQQALHVASAKFVIAGML